MTDTSREALTPTLTPILCDKCGIETPDPWHSSEGANKHIHTCDACHAQQVAVPTLKIKPFTQRLRDNREADYSLDALMPPTRREIASAMYEEVVELRDALKAQQVAVPVPLTDGEIDAVTISQWGEMHGQPLAAHRAFARAIEARLGITQQGDAPCNAYGSYSFGG